MPRSNTSYPRPSNVACKDGLFVSTMPLQLLGDSEVDAAFKSTNSLPVERRPILGRRMTSTYGAVHSAHSACTNAQPAAHSPLAHKSKQSDLAPSASYHLSSIEYFVAFCCIAALFANIRSTRHRL